MRYTPLLCTLFLIISTLHGQSLPEWIGGDWEGIGEQWNTNTQWLTLLSCRPALEKPEVAYPDLQCRGHWEVQRTEADRIVFQERITENSGQCSNQDWIYVEPRGPDTLLVQFAHVWAPKHIIARAWLHRRGLP